MKRFFLAAALAWLSTVALAAYPERPVTIVNPFAAGGLGSNLSRILAEGLSAELGQSVIVEDRAGAGGIIGFNYVKAAAPDGYTLLLGTISTTSLAPSLYKKLPFDTIKDFQPVALTYTGRNFLVVSSQSPYHSLADLARAAKEKPGGLTYATTGNGTTGHIMGGMFKSITGGEMIPVPYKGAGPATLAMAAGECDFWFGTSDVLPQIKSGKLRALAVASDTRYAALPDVPTTREAGFPDLTMESWYGIFAPAGTPPAVTQRLNTAIAHVLANPKVVARVQGLDMEIGRDGSAAYFADRIQTDLHKWQPVIQKAGIHAD